MFALDVVLTGPEMWRCPTNHLTRLLRTAVRMPSGNQTESVSIFCAGLRMRILATEEKQREEKERKRHGRPPELEPRSEVERLQNAHKET